MKTQDYSPALGNQTGCILGEPNDVYHANAAVSHSKLSAFIERPALYKGKYIDKVIPNGNTAAMKLGSAIHSIVLEGIEAFTLEYAVSPDNLQWRGGAAKIDSCHALNELLFDPLSTSEVERIASLNKDDALARFEELPGRTLISKDEWEIVSRARESIFANELCRELMGAGVAEVVFRSEPTVHGFAVQCRADWLNVDPGLSLRACDLLKEDGLDYEEGIPYGCDLKTIASLAGWNADFWKRGYYRAYPFYAKTMEFAVGANIVQEWFWPIVEKEYPYFSMVRPPQPEVWEKGMSDMSEAMPKLGDCMRTGDWRDEAVKKVTRQGLPDWMLSNHPLRVGVQ